MERGADCAAELTGWWQAWRQHALPLRVSFGRGGRSDTVCE